MRLECITGQKSLNYCCQIPLECTSWLCIECRVYVGGGKWVSPLPTPNAQSLSSKAFVVVSGLSWKITHIFWAKSQTAQVVQILEQMQFDFSAWVFSHYILCLYVTCYQTTKVLTKFSLDIWFLVVWVSCGQKWFSSNSTHLSSVEILELTNPCLPVFEVNCQLLFFSNTFLPRFFFFFFFPLGDFSYMIDLLLWPSDSWNSVHYFSFYFFLHILFSLTHFH